MRLALMVAAAWGCAFLVGCGTASIVPVRSSPPGARIFVNGEDTGRVTPARINLQRYARDADQPMALAVHKDGHVATHSWPYPKRHVCSQLICSKRRQHHYPCHLRLERSGTGVRIDAFQSGWEVSLDDGPWTVPAGPTPFPDARGGGLTLPASPGRHRLRWRKHDPHVRKGWGSTDMEVTVPSDGYLQINLPLHP